MVNNRPFRHTVWLGVKKLPADGFLICDEHPGVIRNTAKRQRTAAKESAAVSIVASRQCLRFP